MKIRKVQFTLNQDKYSLNKIAQEQKFKYSCQTHETEKIISYCLFLKILNGFQGCIILADNLLVYESKALSRTLCDPLYLIKIFLDDRSDFWREYLKYSAFITKKVINVARKNRHEIFDLVRKYASQEVINELNERLKNIKEQEFRTEQLAIKAQMITHYDAIFRLMSNEVHTPPYVILRYVEYDDNLDFKSFNYGPAESEYDKLLISIINILIKALIFMDNIYCTERHKEFENIVTAWKSLDEKTV